jgi:nicotinate-nucleotide--dimethylbenzimidazole phosphoribosyltransferase
MKIIDSVRKKIQPLDQNAITKMQLHHADLLMPTGALAVPLSYVEQLAGIMGNRPKIEKKQVVLFAADHGIAAEGISAYPQEVTQQMLGSFAQGWAVITSLAKSQGMDMVVIDMGVKGSVLPSEKIINRKIAAGTKNFLQEDAMSRNEVEKALAVGIAVAKETKERGYDVALIGEMGIGNTTSASAITALLLSLPVEIVTGRGTGVTDETYEKKMAVIKKGILSRKVNNADAVTVLQKVGGFEIAAMTGFLLGAAAEKLPVVLDGFITGAAALVAYDIAPQAKEYWIAGHVSKEIGHRRILEKLLLRPILDLDLRLGEASGAALALPILEQAMVISRDTGTFTIAGVTNKE